MGLAAAAIMNFTGDTECTIFKAVAKKDRNLMQAIQEAMFVFDNLIMSDDKSLQTLMRSVDTEDLVLALREQMMYLLTKFLVVCQVERLLIFKMRWKR